MSTATITNTILDGSGTGVSGVVVTARLRLGPGFRVATSTEVADVSTTTNASGVWSLALEKTANIDPANSYWEIEEQVPATSGGPRLWAITVTNDSALYANLITSLQTAAALPTALTLTAGDARYAQLGANVWTANQTLSDGVNVVLGTVTGSKVGTATSQKLGFFNATPVVQPLGTADIATLLATLGLRASGATPPATLGATTVTTLAASSTLSAGATTVTAGGLSVAGSPSGYGGDELHFTSASNGAAAAVSSSGTGAASMLFDHRGTGNAGTWAWRNGTSAANTQMSLGGTGDLTLASNPGSGTQTGLLLNFSSVGSKRLDCGAADSAGAGFRLVRIPN